MSRKIFNYDEDGFFTGVTDAHVNPEEPGQYLLPARASTMSPPTHDTATHRAKYLGDNQWRIVERNIVEIDGVPVELPNDANIKTVAQLMLNDTMHEVLEAWEEDSPVQHDLAAFRRALRAVLKDKRATLPRRVRVPLWPSIAGVK